MAHNLRQLAACGGQSSFAMPATIFKMVKFCKTVDWDTAPQYSSCREPQGCSALVQHSKWDKEWDEYPEELSTGKTNNDRQLQNPL